MMGIESRGNQNTLVVSGSAVPVSEIADAVIDRKKLDYICSKYPVTVDEVFEAIDVIADTGKYYEGGITLMNRGDDLDIELETISVNDTVFFAMIAYGHSVNPAALNFDEIYNIGLSRAIKDIYSDLAQGATYFESSELHSAIYESLITEIGHIDPETILASLE